MEPRLKWNKIILAAKIKILSAGMQVIVLQFARNPFFIFDPVWGTYAPSLQKTWLDP